MAVKLTSSALITHMLSEAQLSKMEASRRMGRGASFLGNYTNANRNGKKIIPSVELLALVAKVCGFEVHVIGHGEDITVEVADD